MAEKGPWPGVMGTRLRFERGARTIYPTLRGQRVGPGGRGGFRYDVELDIPFFEFRRAMIRFRPGDLTPYVWVDGPTDSPHRYDDGSLCMWFPRDGRSQRWAFDDGLVDLLDVIVAHVFREAWWRETSEWLGPEVAHRSASSVEAS